MKAIIFVIALIFGATMLLAAPKQSPFRQKTEQVIFDSKELKTLKVTYDVSAEAAQGSVGSHPLNGFLPGGAIVKEVWLYIQTQFADSGTGTVALECEDSANLKSATDITGSTAGTIIAGAASATNSGTWVKNIASKCQVTAVVAGSAQSAGKLTGFIHYVVP